MTFRLDWDTSQLARLKELHAQGMRYREIRAEFGISRSAVSGAIMRLGLNQPRSVQRMVKQREQLIEKANRSFNAPPMIAEKPIREVPRTLEFLDRGLLDLEADDCRFPDGDGPAFLFCGQPAAPGSSYCAHHHAICYAQPVRGGKPNNWNVKRQVRA